MLGASKLKTGNAFLRRRPNRPARPSLSRTGSLKTCPEIGEPDPGRRLRRTATEPSPNRSPIGARRGPSVLTRALDAAGATGWNNTVVGRWEPEILRAWCCGALSSGLLNFRFSPPLLPSPRHSPGDFDPIKSRLKVQIGGVICDVPALPMRLRLR